MLNFYLKVLHRYNNRYYKKQNKW